MPTSRGGPRNGIFTAEVVRQIFAFRGNSGGGKMNRKHVFRTFVALLAVGLLSACNSGTGGGGTGGGGTGGGGFLSDSVFSSFFINSYTPADIANASYLRSLPIYNNQTETWWDAISGVYRTTNSLTDSGIEFAHAVGLTGAGQRISIEDNGFLTSHADIASRVWTIPGISTAIDWASSSPGHGTHVATVAAGDGTGGKMAGAAPGAEMLLTDASTYSERAQVNNTAKTWGAIAQNNSWGLVRASGSPYKATWSDYNSIFGSYSGNQWAQSYDNLAQSAVIVFAVSNTTSNTSSDLMDALPNFRPQLENSWIAVANGRPVRSGSTIVGVRLRSSRCLEAARWCIVANGTNWGGDVTGNTSYSWGTGTSFAAPLVTGSIALLAEAFPGLSAQALRARLLASADNSFFAHTGYVQFSPSVRHGYNAEFGHGFLDVKAALLPIGGSYLPLSSGKQLNVTEPLIASGGMAGDALVAALATRSVPITDGLGAGFDVPASIMAAQSMPKFDPMASISNVLGVDLSQDVLDPYRAVSVFSDSTNSQQFELDTEAATLTVLVPALGSPEEKYGISASRVFDLGTGDIRLALATTRETGGFAGLKELTGGSSIAGLSTTASFDWNLPVARNAALRLSGALGVAIPRGTVGDMSFSPVSYNSLNLSYGAHDVLGLGDRFSLGVGMPQAVQSGSMRVTLPATLSDGSVGFDTLDMPLAPKGRQLDLTIAYGMPIAEGAELVMSAVRSLNAGNVAGTNTSEAAIGLRFAF